MTPICAYYSAMICHIKWINLSLGEWQAYFSTLQRSNFLQSYNYARCVMPLYGQKPRWGLIYIDDIPAGLLQLAEAKTLWGALHAIILDRGPLWFDGFGTLDHFSAFVQTYSALFPRRLGRARRFLPEQLSCPDVDAILVQAGWRKQTCPPYQTSWLDLRPDEAHLEKSMRKSWRQSLNKAHKSAIEISWDMTGKMLPYHLKRYELDKNYKGYSGPDSRVISAILKVPLTQDAPLLIGTAKLDKKIIAGMIIIGHGNSATYQVGWLDTLGRQYCAHHALLWSGAQLLKQRGVTDLDLGGWNEDSAKTLQTFKNGIGAQSVTLAGLYS